MKAVLLILVLMFSAVAYADLGDFPDNFIDDGEFSGYIVVGKKGSSTDVISQSTIALKFGGIVEKPRFDINKLDDEVSIENDLILVGNPCVNELTAELLGNPEPCNKGYPAGMASIRYLENNGFKYIIVAGSTDKETKEAAQYLANYNDYVVEGDEIEIKITTDEAVKKAAKKAEDTEDKDADDEDADDEDADDAGDSGEDDADADSTDNKKGDKPVPELYEDETGKTPIVVTQERNIFQKFWRWLSGVFS